MVEHFWLRYRKQVLKWCLYPFVVYFVCTLYYLSIFGVDGVEDPDDAETEIVLRIVLVLFEFYFIRLEVLCIIRDGITYFSDFYNIFDIVSFGLNLYVILQVSFGLDKERGEEM